MLGHTVPLLTVYLLLLQVVYSSSSIIEIYDDSRRDMPRCFDARFAFSLRLRFLDSTSGGTTIVYGGINKNKEKTFS